MAAEKSKGGRRTGGPEEAVFLELARTVEALSHPVVQLLKGRELSPTQYNVLRILRGSPEGLTCGSIGDRMVTRDPDITRLLDRLEKRKLIERSRDQKDRRIVLSRITAEGLELLAELDAPMHDTHHRMLGHLGTQRLSQLSELLTACRAKLG